MVTVVTVVTIVTVGTVVTVAPSFLLFSLPSTVKVTLLEIISGEMILTLLPSTRRQRLTQSMTQSSERDLE